MKKEFVVNGKIAPSPVNKQALADARFDLRFQAILYAIVKDCQGGQ